MSLRAGSDKPQRAKQSRRYAIERDEIAASFLLAMTRGLFQKRPHLTQRKLQLLISGKVSIV